MTMTPVKETHIYLDETGRAYVKPSGFKVRMIIEGLAAGYSPEGYVADHSGITLAEVYAALAYYHDHRVEMDEEIKKARGFAEDFLAKNPESELTKRLREAI
jgi:uncharacterized protein (DUF433 family)